MVLIIGGFIVIPNMFMEQSKPVDYTILQREAIPEKILDMMDKYDLWKDTMLIVNTDHGFMLGE